MYFTIDTFMTRELKLSKTELLVYALIYSFSQGENGCYWASIPTTAIDLGVSEFAVKAAIKALTAKGLIKSVGVHPEKRTNEYVAIIPQNVRGRKSTEGVENQPIKGAKINPLGGRKSTPIIKDNKEIIKNSVPSIFDRQ